MVWKAAAGAALVATAIGVTVAIGGPWRAQRLAAAPPMAERVSATRRDTGSAPPASVRTADAAAAPLPDRITLTDGVHAFKAAPRDLGIDAATRHLEAPVARRALERIARRVAYPGVSARLMEAHGTFTTTRSQMARRLDIPEALARLSSFAAAPPSDGVMRLPLIKTRPRVVTEDLRGIDAQISSFATHYNAGEVPRTHNIHLVVERLDGAVIRPGEVFSFNGTTGERTARKGFETAKVFMDGKLADGLGGGTCQVSSTLYNAALLADLRIVRRDAHSLTVPYISPGRDATVYYGQHDLKFKNNTGAPIYIRARAGDGRLVFTLYGHKTPGREVELRTRVRRHGDHVTGILWRIVKQNGSLVSRRLMSENTYRPLEMAGKLDEASPHPERRRIRTYHIRRAVVHHARPAPAPAPTASRPPAPVSPATG